MSHSLTSLPDTISCHPYVLKYRFYDYSGMVRPTDQKTMATEKPPCSLKFPREEGVPPWAGPQRRSGGGGGARKMWARAFVGAPTERSERGRTSRRGLR